MIGPVGGRFPSRRYDRLRGAQLAPVRVRRTTPSMPVTAALTPTRRKLLEAIAADRKPPLVRWFASTGWRCAGKTVNKLVRDVVAAGWAAETAWPRTSITLTDAGRAAIGGEQS